MLSVIAEDIGTTAFFTPRITLPDSSEMTRICSVYNIELLKPGGANSFARWRDRRRLKRSLQNADLILVDSDFTGGRFDSAFPGFTDKQVVLYPDLGPAWEEGERLARQQPAPPLYREPYLLYVGSFDSHKNVELLVQAFHRYIEENPDSPLKLILASKNIFENRSVESAVRTHSDRIEIRHNLSDRRLRSLYENAIFFITASAYDSFGHPVVEAMACGCPVICPPGTALEEVSGGAAVPIVELSETGVLKAINAALAMPVGIRLELVQRGDEQMRMFLPGSTADGFSALLDELTQSE